MTHRTAPIALLVAVFTLACRADRPTSTVTPDEPARATEGPTSTARPDRRPEPARGDPEQGRLAGITAAHNRVREPLGLPPLIWSDELAAYAQSWVDKLERKGCPLQHRPRTGPDAQRHGENIFSMTGQSATVNDVVDSWAAEVEQYDAKTNRCKGVCGHYTQIVWRASQRVGCAMAACGDTEVWLCNYDPPGNFVGQRPY
jgi:uncharacterized protein YkwD